MRQYTSNYPTMIVSRGLLAALAIVCGLVLPSSAATSTSLSVSSAGNGVVTVRLARAIELTESVSLSGTGQYKVAAIFPVTVAGARIDPLVVYSDPGAPGGRTRLGAVGDHGKTRLPAGTYRVYLASDKPVTLRWAVLGNPGTSAYQARPTSFQVKRTTARPPASLLPLESRESTHDFNRTRGLTFLASRYEITGSVGPARDEFGLCLAKRGQACDAGFDTAFTVVYGGDHTSTVTAGLIVDQDFAPFTGAVTSKATYDGIGVDHVRSETFLTIEFPG